MNTTEKNNIANLLAELTAMMVAQDEYCVACFSDDLCRASSSPEARPYVDALITISQDFSGGYGWTDTDVERAESLLAEIVA